MAIVIVGPINPDSEAGHRFILILVEYATKYAEAVSLQRIDAETLAELLVNMHSRWISAGDIERPRYAVHIRLYDGNMPLPKDQAHGDYRQPVTQCAMAW
ncbi:Zinc finger protein [Plakobranchus ocellatus]|uniref:Zinc finger protein n=1 Tax=Plakobranchus ocellatus TaxID=259542 RepID=A0AAV3ZCT9_9GAST|nr:Zinc finger protein [Plakobranchus ocellatus]